MIGAIAGDIIGSVYEGRPIPPAGFPLFHRHAQPTDDTVLTVALADSILNGTDYVRLLKEYVHRYPRAGYGGSFLRGQCRCPRPRTTAGVTARRCV